MLFYFVLSSICSNFAPRNKMSMRNLTNAELAQILDKDIFHEISEAADALSVECYVVGGYVRDLFLERPSNDIDVVVVGSGIEVASALKKKLGKKAHLSVFRNFGTAQVKYKDTEVEFVGARKESYNRDSRKPIVEDGTLEDDQNRRDFTINAMAVCLNKDRFGELVDPFDGVYDLEDGIIATPLDPDITFSDDPLRMMRCVRFATQLNFQIEDETYAALSRNAERLKIISGERICDEMNKIMLSKHPSSGFYYLKDTGLLDLILPELVAMDKVETRNGKAHKNNYDHTMEVLENVCKHSDNLWLRWAALFHDIVRRLLNDAGDDINDLMTLCEADITSKNQVRKQRFLDNFKMVREKLVDLQERDYKRLLQPCIDGNEIMEMFQLKPCREVGVLKQYLKDAVLDNKVANEREPLMELLMKKAQDMGLNMAENLNRE